VRWYLLCCLGLIFLCGLSVQALPQAPKPAQSRLGINLAGLVDWNTELPFVDLFHLARAWISQQEGKSWGQGPPLALDEHGWVKHLEPGCYAETLLCTGEEGHYPPGRYVCLYDGKGKIEFGNIKKVVSEAPGRLVFEPDPAKGTIFLKLTATDPSDYVRNIRVLLPGFEHKYRDNPFNPAFLARWKHFNTYRFMDWMQTNGSKVAKWSQRPKVDDYTWTLKGAPLEIMLDLCNRQHANPWFCMPHLADDDYVRHFAELVKGRLDPDLRVYVEYSNEVWNSMFAQTRYANEQGLKLGLGDKPWDAGWHYSARRSVELFKIWEQVFGGTERLVRVMASQTTPYVCEQKLAFEDAYKFCDALAIAPYFGLIATPDSKPPAKEVRNWSQQQVLDYLEQTVLPQVLDVVKQDKALADKYGVQLIAYEAGQHLVGAGGAENDEQLTRLFLAANRSKRMGELYTRFLDGWLAAGGGLCCLYDSVGPWTKWGSWGLLEYPDEPTPKYETVVEWNNTHPLKDESLEKEAQQ